jgi:hypothetical protein
VELGSGGGEPDVLLASGTRVVESGDESGSDQVDGAAQQGVDEGGALRQRKRIELGTERLVVDGRAGLERAVVARERAVAALR